MPTPAVTLTLGSRLDFYARDQAGRLWRSTSFDGGTTWPADWNHLADIQLPVVPTGDTGWWRPAVAASGDNRCIHLAALPAKPGKFIYTRTDTHSLVWTQEKEIGAGLFTSSPAMAVSGDGKLVFAAGRGQDNMCWWARSGDGGESWNPAWVRIPSGKFETGAAVAMSANGSRVYVFARGLDNRIWWAVSSNSGNSWDMAWAAIGSGVFTSAPAACCSADGQRIYVFGRGNDNRYWWAFSTTGGASWDMAWDAIGAGVFTSSPAAATSWDGSQIHVCGTGNDGRVWRAASLNSGGGWQLAWAPVGNKSFE